MALQSLILLFTTICINIVKYLAKRNHLRLYSACPPGKPLKTKLPALIRGALKYRTWDSTSTTPGLCFPACLMKSSRLPLPRGGGVSMLFSIPFSIMSSRPPDATITRNVSTDGSTAELRRTEPEFNVVLKLITEPLRAPPLLFTPYSCLRGTILCARRVCSTPINFLKFTTKYYVRKQRWLSTTYPYLTFKLREVR